MSDSPTPAAANDGADDTPTIDTRTAQIPDDPRLTALLNFEPAPRKVKRPDGWTPDRQREFIRLIVETGSPQRAARAMGKVLSGAEEVYRGEGAEGFRAAWDSAVDLAAERRRRGDVERIRAGIADPPHRRWQGDGGRRGRDAFEPEPESDVSEEQKLELIENIAVKFLRKVVAEREARLRGEIVAADFYLRQITSLEVSFELMTERYGVCPYQVLHDLRRGGHQLLQIVDSPFTQYLDNKRREYWVSNGEPMRPIAFREEFAVDHGDHRTAIDQHAYGAMTSPARGYTKEEWATMDYDAQKAARLRQFDQDAAEQVEWEREAHEAWEAEYGAQAREQWEGSELGIRVREAWDALQQSAEQEAEAQRESASRRDEAE